MYNDNIWNWQEKERAYTRAEVAVESSLARAERPWSGPPCAFGTNPPQQSGVMSACLEAAIQTN